MPPLNSDEQFQFLISCIRHSNNGKVDFTKVAGECAIVTKGAAAKRYERLMKAHNIHPTGAADSTTSSPRPKKKTIGTKRKPTTDADACVDGDDNADVEAGEGTPSKKGRKIKDKAVESAQKLVAKNTAGTAEKDVEDDDEDILKLEQANFKEETEDY